MELQTRGLQRRAAVVGQRRPHRGAVLASCLGLRVVATFELPLDRPDAADLFLEQDLGVAVGLVDRPRRLAEVVELAELVGHAGQRLGDGLADRMLPVGDHADDGHLQGLFNLADEPGQITLAGGE